MTVFSSRGFLLVVRFDNDMLALVDSFDNLFFSGFVESAYLADMDECSLVVLAGAENSLLLAPVVVIENKVVGLIFDAGGLSLPLSALLLRVSKA